MAYPLRFCFLQRVGTSSVLFLFQPFFTHLSAGEEAGGSPLRARTLGVAYPLRAKGGHLFCSVPFPAFLYAPICRYFQPLTICVRMISKKYIDTQTTSCYSLPCISNPISADLLTLFPT